MYKLSVNKVRKWKTDERQLLANAVGAPTVATAHADDASSEPGKLDLSAGPYADNLHLALDR